MHLHKGAAEIHDFSLLKLLQERLNRGNEQPDAPRVEALTHTRQDHKDY
jgi:hypothetical protein